MRGDTLIEVLIAMAIAVVVVTSITTLGISSLNNAKFVASQDQATKYTQEGMEVVRRIRSNNYALYATYDGIYCLAKNSTTLSATACTSPNIDNQYVRSVEIRPDDGCGTDLSHTVVRVSWTDGKCNSGTYCHTTELSSCLSTVPPIPEP